MKKIEGYIYFFALLFSVWLANWFIGNVGYCEVNSPCVIPVFPDFSGGWILAPSGVLVIGLSFTFRDLVQRKLGIVAAIASILLGAALSAWFNPFLAIASGVAFLISEFLDLMVYTPLQERHLTWAVVASNLVGLTVDSIVFLTLAFGSLMFLEGQIIGKLLMLPVGLILVHGIRWLEVKRLAIN
jgi:uncharacterized PurR-regulated membrane protein YhhQ (DUF165 family)